MDAPPIRYCRSADSVNIAYWTIGEGRPLLILQAPGPSHVQVEWNIPEIAQTFERFACHCQLIRFDFRNCGMSDRGVDACSFDEQYADLLAVVSTLRLTDLVLYGEFTAAKHAVRFAAERPGNTAGLILSTPDFGPARRPNRAPVALRTVARLIETDWDAYVDATAAISFGLEDPRTAQFVAQRLRTGIDPADVRRMGRATDAADIEPLLAQVEAPTRVVHLDAPIYDAGTTRACAAALTHSQLIVLADAVHPWVESFQNLVLGFLDELEGITPAPVSPPSPVDRDAIPLSEREVEVLRLIAVGFTNSEIAEALVIAPGTAARHVQNILNKTALRNRVELTRYAYQYGLAGAGVGD